MYAFEMTDKLFLIHLLFTCSQPCLASYKLWLLTSSQSIWNDYKKILASLRVSIFPTVHRDGDSVTLVLEHAVS